MIGLSATVLEWRERKNGDDVVPALNRKSYGIQRQKRYGTFTTRETVLPVALPSAL